VVVAALAFTATDHASAAQVAAGLRDDGPLSGVDAVVERYQDPIARLPEPVGQRGIGKHGPEAPAAAAGLIDGQPRLVIRIETSRRNRGEPPGAIAPAVLLVHDQ